MSRAIGAELVEGRGDASRPCSSPAASSRAPRPAAGSCRAGSRPAGTSRSSDSSTVASSSSRSVGAEHDARAAQAVDRGLGRGERGAQVVADRADSSAVRSRSTSASGPAAAACSASRSCRSATAAWAANACGQPPVGGGERMSAQHQRERRRRPGSRRRPRPGVRHGRSPTAAGDPPGVRVVCRRPGPAGRRPALEQGDAGEAERLAELVEQGGQRPGAAQHAAGQGGQGLRLGPGAAPPRGSAGRPGRP